MNKITTQRIWEIIGGIFGIAFILGIFLTITILFKIRYEEYRQEYSVAEEQLMLEVESFSIRDNWFKVNTSEGCFYTRTFVFSTEVNGMYVILTKKDEMNIARFLVHISSSSYPDDIYRVVVVIGE